VGDVEAKAAKKDGEKNEADEGGENGSYIGDVVPLYGWISRSSLLPCSVSDAATTAGSSWTLK